jgi:hypothetical protein
MTGHPDRVSLETFLRGGLPAHETKAVLAHLVGGCPRCKAQMAPFTTAMFEPAPEEEPILTPEMSAAYDVAIAGAFAKVLRVAEAMQPCEDLEGKMDRLLHGFLPEEAGFWTWPLCERLLERSHELRHDDPAEMLRWAKLARQGADRLVPETGGSQEAQDLRARAWAEMANAYRVNDDLPQAEAAMAWAMELHGEGTGSPRGVPHAGHGPHPVPAARRGP